MRPWKLMSGLMAFWFFVLLYMTSSLYQSCEKTEHLERQLDRTMEDMKALTSQNKQLQAMAKELRYTMGWSLWVFLLPASEGWEKVLFSQVSVCPQEERRISPERTGLPLPSLLARARTVVRRGRYASCVHAGGLSCLWSNHSVRSSEDSS